MSPQQIRTRFAPSPTGYVHIGSVRTALYSYLFAKKHQGSFILRIEDTDRSRYVEGALENLLQVFDALKLTPDEGCMLDTNGQVTEKGSFGPYVQSNRLAIYQQYVHELIQKEQAYYCFCSAERLEKVRTAQQNNKMPPMYDRHCRDCDTATALTKIAQNEPYVIRFKTPLNGITELNDLVYGKITTQNQLLDDFVLIKSDGYPTYHFANIIDDHLMQISHVIRGEEWLSSTPKHLLLYKAFNWTPPQFAHLPLLLNPDRSKLSKRKGDVSTSSFLNKGYLPETLLNFIALLGWNPKIEQEIFSLTELVNAFDLPGVNKYGAVLDIPKLDWMNGVYIRSLDLETFTNKCIPYLEQANFIQKITDNNFQNLFTNEEINKTQLSKILNLEKERIKKFADITDNIAFMFNDYLPLDINLLAWKKMTTPEAQKNLKTILTYLESIPEADFNASTLTKTIENIKNITQLSTGELLWPLRVSLAKQKNSPGPFEIAEALGKTKTIQRIQKAITL